MGATRGLSQMLAAAIHAHEAEGWHLASLNASALTAQLERQDPLTKRKWRLVIGVAPDGQIRRTASECTAGNGTVGEA